MLTLLNRFSKYSIVIFGFLAITLSHAQDDRAEDISILDVDANGEVDALTDGLLLLRSMFGLTDDVLTTGVISANATVSDATAIDSYITSMKDTTYGKLNSSGEAGPAGPQGEKGDKGDTGSQGVAGTDGSDGAKGDTGIQGVKGDTGSQGEAGTDGAKGDTGSQGIAGTDGANGTIGAKGDAGADGTNGAKGDTGANGVAGATGATGAKGEMGADGVDGADGADGNSSGAVGVSFAMDLRGTPTTWAGSGAPPATVSVDPLGPYILYTGEDSTNNGIIPRLPKNFEFIHLEGNSWASAPNPNPGYFPSTEWVQSVNLHATAVNNHKLPQLGPISNGSLTSYNNFYGFRVPQDGKMVGFQINYIQKAMTGQFYAMYYKPDSENPVVIFNKGGPLVGGMNASGPISTNYASGNTLWDDSVSIPVKANGFIFVMSDLSCGLDGPYTNNWNSQIGPGPAVPFRPPSGKIHATVYVTYD